MENNQEVVQNIEVQQKKYVVKCPKCGAELYVKDNSAVAFMCPVCSNLFRMRLGSKKVKDVSPITLSETYTSITKEASEK